MNNPNKQYYEPFSSLFISFYYFNYFFDTLSGHIEQNIPGIKDVTGGSSLEVVMEFFKHHTFEISVKGAFYNSVIVALHSLVEESFNKISAHVSQKLNISFTINDFKKPISNQIMHYFEGAKLNGINNHDISKISSFNKIRNCIVHDNGIVKQNSPVKKVLSQYKNIEVDKFKSKLLVSKDFCSSQIKYFESILIQIADNNNYSYELSLPK
jgi:hypothetical protein